MTDVQLTSSPGPKLIIKNDALNVLPSYDAHPYILEKYLKKDKAWLETLPETGTRNRLISLVNERLARLSNED